MWNTIVIKKEWISWIITTLRNLTWLDYNSGGKEIVKEYEDCELAIIMFLLEGELKNTKISFDEYDCIMEKLGEIKKE